MVKREDRSESTDSGRSVPKDQPKGDRASQPILERLGAQLDSIERRIDALEQRLALLESRWEARFPSPRNSCPRCGRMSHRERGCSWCGTVIEPMK